MNKKNKGFGVLELFFWVGVFALLVGGYAYKNTKEFQKNPIERGIDSAEKAETGFDRLRVKDYQNEKAVNESR